MKGVITLALIVLLVLAIQWIWPSNKAIVTEDNNKVHYHFDDVDIYLDKDKKVDAVNMVFGFQSKDDIVGNGYLALIPIAVANKLKEQYPEMGQCTGEGNEFAKQNIVNTHLIYDPAVPGLSEKIAGLRIIQQRMTYNICMRLKGSTLNRTSTQYNGRQSIVYDNAVYLYVSDAEIVDCGK